VRRTVGTRVITRDTSRQMRELMRMIVEDGTGKNADLPGYLIGGKTGTADKAAGRGYNTRKLISSFVGAFPIDEPEYAVLAILDEPKGNKKTYGYATGGWVAAPVVKNVVAHMAQIMGLAPTDRLALEELERKRLKKQGPTKPIVTAQRTDAPAATRVKGQAVAAN
jgi:cell division protein FtsI (penicillin-binding protein 3)